MFIRVKSRVTGHEFDIHEEKFDEARYTRVKRYKPSRRVRRTKFRVGILPALSISPVGEEKVVEDVADNSAGD